MSDNIPKAAVNRAITKLELVEQARLKDPHIHIDWFNSAWMILHTLGQLRRELDVPANAAGTEVVGPAAEAPGGPVCTLAWVEQRVAEIKELRRHQLEDTSVMSKAWFEDNDALNGMTATLYSAVIGAIAFNSCEPDAVTVCRAAAKACSGDIR